MAWSLQQGAGNVPTRYRSACSPMMSSHSRTRQAQIISQTAQQLQLLEQRGTLTNTLPTDGCAQDYAIVGRWWWQYPYAGTCHAGVPAAHHSSPASVSMRTKLTRNCLPLATLASAGFHVCELALKRLDAKGQAEIDKLHLESGWSNESRSQYDLPNIPRRRRSLRLMNLGVVKVSETERGQHGRPSD